ncbi:probable serine/threonine-protein kinase DDB_G0282963 [Centruroides sculpturatus]|uniref:probable serine/threonine-protein kinase DDB_G0282963 n=1 Tax=Centruroides sculpturatus TaxID=218467 RepID=UPI000C6D3D2A|nr:probable serine/threonine-protein kinase DDB_G0282963 [Centruroides sculpturatus]
MLREERKEMFVNSFKGKIGIFFKCHRQFDPTIDHYNRKNDIPFEYKYENKDSRSSYEPSKDSRSSYESSKDYRSSYDEPRKDSRSSYESNKGSRSNNEPVKSSKSRHEPNKNTRNSYETTKDSRSPYRAKDYDYSKEDKSPIYEPNKNSKYLGKFHPNIFSNSKSDGNHSKKSDNSFPSLIDNPRKSTYHSGEVDGKQRRTSFKEPELDKLFKNYPKDIKINTKAISTSTEESDRPTTSKEVIIKNTVTYDDDNLDNSKEDEKPLTVDKSENLESKAKTNKRHDQYKTDDHHHYKTTPPPIPGVAGVDYPIYATVPMTHFNCSHYKPGYYADPDTMCQVFHICQAGGAMDSFLCPNGTMFNQLFLVCDWWYNVHCGKSRSLYEKSNARLYIVPKTKRDDSQKQDDDNTDNDKKSSGTVTTRIQAVGYGKNDKSVNSYAYQEVTEGGLGHENYVYEY